LILGLSFVSCSFWTVAKGILPLFHTDELYFWLTTYRDGLARRGFVGTLIAPLLKPVTPSQVHLLSASFCLAGLTCTIALASIILWRALAESKAKTIFIVAILVAVSPCLGLIAFHVGYPDSLIATLVLVCGLLFPRVSAYAVSVLLLIYSAIHELAFLLVVPIAVFTCMTRDGWGLKEFVAVAAGTFSGLLVIFLGTHIPNDLVNWLVLAGLTSGEARVQVETALQQTITAAASKMIVTWQTYSLNGIIGVIYAGLPGFCITCLGLSSAIRWSTAKISSWLFRLLFIMAYILSCLSSLALLLVAWDLARLVSFSTLTAFVTSNVMLQQTYAKPGWKLSCISVMYAILLTFMPILNLYFDYGRPLHLRLVSAVCLPCVEMEVSLIDFLNRSLTPAERAAIDTDKRFDCYFKQGNN